MPVLVRRGLFIWIITLGELLQASSYKTFEEVREALKPYEMRLSQNNQSAHTFSAFMKEHLGRIYAFEESKLQEMSLKKPVFEELRKNLLLLSLSGEEKQALGTLQSAPGGVDAESGANIQDLFVRNWVLAHVVLDAPVDFMRSTLHDQAGTCLAGAANRLFKDHIFLLGQLLS